MLFWVLLFLLVRVCVCVYMCYLENLEFAMNVKHFSAPAKESRWIGSKQNIGSIILSLKKKNYIYIYLIFLKKKKEKHPLGNLHTSQTLVAAVGGSGWEAALFLAVCAEDGNCSLLLQDLLLVSAFNGVHLSDQISQTCVKGDCNQTCHSLLLMANLQTGLFLSVKYWNVVFPFH